jgi:hypothetical protein
VVPSADTLPPAACRAAALAAEEEAEERRGEIFLREAKRVMEREQLAPVVDRAMSILHQEDAWELPRERQEALLKRRGVFEVCRETLLAGHVAGRKRRKSSTS